MQKYPSKHQIISISIALLGIMLLFYWLQPKKNLPAPNLNRVAVYACNGQFMYFLYEDEKRQASPQDIAPYTQEVLRQELQTWANETKRNPYQNNIKIFTTIHPKAQKIAEEAVKKRLDSLQKIFLLQYAYLGKKPWIDEHNNEIPNFIERQAKISYFYKQYVAQHGDTTGIGKALRKPKKMSVFDAQKGEKDTLCSVLDSIAHQHHFLQAGFSVIEPKTGKIIAWVGGRNIKYFPQNTPLTSRQMMSIALPMLHGVFLDKNGGDVCKKWKSLSDALSPFEPQKDIPEIYKTRSLYQISSGYPDESMIMSRTTAPHKNEYLQKLGKMDNPEITEDAYTHFSFLHIDIRLRQLARLFASFVHDGYAPYPTLIAHIEQAGKRIYTPKGDETPLFKKESAYEVLRLLCNNWLSKELQKDTSISTNNEFFVYSRITSQNANSVLIGSTPNLQGAIWIGGITPFTHFYNIAYGQGAVACQPIWTEFFQRLYADEELRTLYPKSKFFPDKSITITCEP